MWVGGGRSKGRARHWGCQHRGSSWALHLHPRLVSLCGTKLSSRQSPFDGKFPGSCLGKEEHFPSSCPPAATSWNSAGSIGMSRHCWLGAGGSLWYPKCLSPGESTDSKSLAKEQERPRKRMSSQRNQHQGRCSSPEGAPGNLERAFGMDGWEQKDPNGRRLRSKEFIPAAAPSQQPEQKVSALALGELSPPLHPTPRRSHPSGPPHPSGSFNPLPLLTPCA